MAKKKPILDPEGEQQAAAGEETASQRAQRIARETVEKKKKAADARKAEALKKAQALSEGYMKSGQLLFLPYKDRDGKTVPCLVTGSQEDYKREANGDHSVDPETRELIPEFQLLVWVFSGASVPHQAIYRFDETKKGA